MLGPALPKNAEEEVAGSRVHLREALAGDEPGVAEEIRAAEAPVEGDAGRAGVLDRGAHVGGAEGSGDPAGIRDIADELVLGMIDVASAQRMAEAVVLGHEADEEFRYQCILRGISVYEARVAPLLYMGLPRGRRVTGTEWQQ